MPDAKILIVEDEGIQALDMQHRLVSLGYPLPEIASSGEEAVRKAKEIQPDLVLMDIMLPGEIDGVTATEQIRAAAEIPIIYITAYADEETLNRARITEPYGYVVKPFKEKELHITIDMALYKHKMEKKLKESEKWLATTLKSIGDGVIAVDRDGRITFMNAIAETLMGWKAEEALGRKLADIFNIINRDTRRPAENPVAKVLRSGFIVGLANHTLLIAHNGKEIPIDDSAAPIKDEQGNIAGVILVFRDIEERDRHEREREMTVEFLHLVNGSSGTADLIKSTASFFQKKSGCEAVGIRLREGEDFPYFEARGFPQEFVMMENQLCMRDAAGLPVRDSAGNQVIECMCGNVICGRFDESMPFFTRKGSFWTNSTTDLLAGTSEADRQSRTRNRCNGEGYESVALFPLCLGKERLGLLQLNDRRRGMFTPDIISSWERMTDYLAIALSKFRADDAVLRAKEEWERTFRTIPDMIAILDKDHRVVRVNQAMSARLGLTPDQCIGVKCYEAVHGLSTPPEFCPHSLTCQDGVEHVVEVHEPVLGGDFLVSTTPMCDEKQQLIGSIHVARNITERKRMEEALRKSEELLKRAQEIAHLGSWELDLVHNRLTWSDEVYRIFGLQTQEFGATYEAFLERVHPDDRAYVKDAYSASLHENRDVYEIEHRVVCKDTGDIRFVHEKCGHFRDATDKIVRSVGMVQDITERKRVEDILAKQTAQLQERTTQLENINKELESFSYSVSHDLRAPLRAIEGYSRMILKKHGDKIDKEILTKFNVIRENTEQMERLITDLLNLSRMGKESMTKVQLNMSDLANEVWKELQVINPDRVMKLNVSGMPDAYADRTLIRQVYFNLLSNAIKFTKKREMAVIETGSCPKGDEPVYYVRDNGAGFNMAYHDKLFGVFQRLHNKAEYEGTGLGLAIVQRVIHRHGGKVWAEGEEDKGATFYFTLPRKAQLP